MIQSDTGMIHSDMDIIQMFIKEDLCTAKIAPSSPMNTVSMSFTGRQYLTYQWSDTVYQTQDERMVGAGYASSVVYPWIIGCFGLDTIHPPQGGQLQADQTRACVQTRHEKERLLFIYFDQRPKYCTLFC